MTMFFEVGVPSFISLKEERQKKELFEKRGKKHVIFLVLCTPQLFVTTKKKKRRIWFAR